jgi:hypothetical protein
MQALRGRGDIVSSYYCFVHGVSGHRHAPAAVYPWERNTVPIGYEAG